MIGCLILGTFAVMGAARFIHHRNRCVAHFGGYGGYGGFGPPCGIRRMRHLHRHGWGGWGGPGYGPGMDGGGFGGGYSDPNGGAYAQEDQQDGDPWQGGGRHHGRGMAGFILHSILGRVRATATQERVIRGAVDEFREEMKNVGSGEGKKTREDIASALRKGQFDEVFMGELFARQDTAIEKTRKAFVGLIAKVHDVLDEEQRGRLAQMVEKGPRFWRRGFDW